MIKNTKPYYSNKSTYGIVLTANIFKCHDYNLNGVQKKKLKYPYIHLGYRDKILYLKDIRIYIYFI